jgi:hypothetical protein
MQLHTQLLGRTGEMVHTSARDSSARTLAKDATVVKASTHATCPHLHRVCYRLHGCHVQVEARNKLTTNDGGKAGQGNDTL